MSEHVDSVKQAADLLRDHSARLSERGNSALAEERLVLAENLEAAAKEIIRLSGLTSALPHDIGNIHDLPSDLLAELSVTKTDDLEDQIVTVINAYGGAADIDRVLIGLYRKFKVSQKRRFLQNKLWRMKDAGILWTVPGKKGVYTTQQPDELEVNEEDPNADLLGEPKEAPKDEEESDEIPF